MLPYDHNHLTEPEQATQQAQQKRDCTKCGNAQIHQRGGARVCVEPLAPDTKLVIAGQVHCEYWA